MAKAQPHSITWDASRVGDGCDGVVLVLLKVNSEGGAGSLSKVRNSQGTGKRTARESSSHQPPQKAPGFEHLLFLALGIEQLPESCNYTRQALPVRLQVSPGHAARQNLAL